MFVLRLDKLKENHIALSVLPDLLKELDMMSERKRLLSIIEGILAANIFDWGAKECISQYYEKDVLSIYKDSKKKLVKRPWLKDDFDAFEKKWFVHHQQQHHQRNII